MKNSSVTLRTKEDVPCLCAQALCTGRRVGRAAPFSDSEEGVSVGRAGSGGGADESCEAAEREVGVCPGVTVGSH